MKRLLPFIIGIIVLLAFVVAIPLLLQPESHRSQLADLLSRQLGRKVVIGKLEAGIFPPMFKLHEVAVMDATGSSPALQIERLEAGTTLGALIKFAFEPKSLTFYHWLLTIHRRANGSWDSDDWSAAVGKTAEGGGLSNVVSHQGECHWVDPFAPGSTELVLQGIEGSFDKDQMSATLAGNLTGLAATLGVHVDAKGHFLSDPDWSGDLRMTDSDRSWGLHLTGKKGLLMADGLATQWRADTVAGLIRFYTRWSQTVAASSTPALLQNWKSQFVCSGSSFTFQQEGALAGGRLKANGSAASTGGQFQGQASVTVENVPLPVLGDLAGFSSPADGALSATAQFSDVFSSDPWQSLSGDATVDVAQGRYRLPESALHKLAKAHTFGYLKAKFPNVEQDGVPFSHIHLRGQAKDGVTTISNGLLDAGDVRAAVAGAFDGARRGVEGYVRL
ncbi:MAG TPA: AsmA-like C-terminal region-containing protein, partial [Elusimicrobiota bacterium]|nr:AsmA-like C-terminal region-containing protein [Elusimicrobiota bacterium]